MGLKELLGAFTKLRKATTSFVMPLRLPARMEQIGYCWTCFREILYLIFFSKTVRKIQFSLKSDKIMDTVTEDRYTFSITSHSFLLRMRTDSAKSCSENQNTYFVFSNFLSKIVPFKR